MIRTKILNFLQWDDRNGCYTDENCILEGYEPCTLKEAILHFIYGMHNALATDSDDCIDYEDITSVTEAFKRKPIIKEMLYYLITHEDSVRTYRHIIDLI